jgi:hypothetical protein
MLLTKKMRFDFLQLSFGELCSFVKSPINNSLLNRKGDVHHYSVFTILLLITISDEEHKL